MKRPITTAPSITGLSVPTNQIYNFNPGPSMLPKPVMDEIRTELSEQKSNVPTILEIGHRSKAFNDICEKSAEDLKALMNIPSDYRILFMHGGARLQFSAIPLNLSTSSQSADYLITGHWGQQAQAEAQRYTNTTIACDTRQDLRAPWEEEISLNPKSTYAHYTPNETLSGIEFPYVPQTDKIPLIADMSSCILSRHFDVTDFSVIYACTQKNLGISGLSIVIVDQNLLGHQHSLTPSLLNWQSVSDSNSLANTPPTFTWYVCSKMLEWARSIGGVEQMEAMNLKKSALLYSYIDSSELYQNPIEPRSRSRTNVIFSLKDESLNDKFLREATDCGLLNLKGHRLTGGMRASLYNAMPIAGVRMLIEFMREFNKNA